MYTAKVNDKHFKLNDVRDVISFVFSIPLKHSTYPPIDVMKENLKEAVDIVCEFLAFVKQDRAAAGKKGGELGSITRLITRLNEFKDYIEDATSIDRLNVQAYNLVMSYEGCGLLNGFGMSNRHGDKILGNPETQSICPTDLRVKRAIIKARVRKSQTI